MTIYDTGRFVMSTDLNETIATLARTSIYSRDELVRVAREYPDADFLRFVASSWDSGVRLAVWQLAEVFYAHPGGIHVSEER